MFKESYFTKDTKVHKEGIKVFVVLCVALSADRQVREITVFRTNGFLDFKKAIPDIFIEFGILEFDGGIITSGFG